MPGNGLETDAKNEDMPDFMSAVMTIDSELPDDDVDSMKFLCQGLLGGKKLSKVDTAHELVSLLQAGNLVTPNDFFLLADLLQYISRVDVLERIGFKEQEVMKRRHQQGSRVKPFYVLLFQISDELDTDEVKKAAFFYGKVPRSRKVSNGLDLFTVMVEHQKIVPENVDFLTMLFHSLDREDIVELVRRYVETKGDSVMRDLEQNFMKSMSLYGGTFNQEEIFPQHSQVPRPQPERKFLEGQGPSMHDIHVRGSASDRGDTSHSDMNSIVAQPSTGVPSAPPLSLPVSMEQGQPPPGPQAEVVAVPPPQLPESQPASMTSTVPLEGYDCYDIPWKVLNILAGIPQEFWPEISYQLGTPVTSDWTHLRGDHKHKNLIVLKRWLDLPETQAMDTAFKRFFLVETLNKSGPTLLAEEIAGLLGINYNDVVHTSSSSTDTNDIASVASAGVQTGRGAVDNAGEGMMNTASTGVVLPATFQSPLPMYRMTSKPRGHCVIINNRNFYEDPHRPHLAKKIGSREGTDVDRDKLVATFRKLDFLVKSFDNCTDLNMLEIINREALENHTRFDCFVCCILSHGVQGQVYGVNGITVPIKDLTSPLRAQTCHTLAGKPKLFFLQACQGREKQEGHSSDLERDSEMEVDAPPAELIPNEADFLLGYATVPGFVSYRSKTKGSWYITKLTELLDKFAPNHDILDILTLVNYEVGKGDALIDGGTYKQSPAPMYSLRKKLIFGL